MSAFGKAEDRAEPDAVKIMRLVVASLLARQTIRCPTYCGTARTHRGR